MADDPLLLPDGMHLAAGSPCIGAGIAGVISGADLDGQPWNSPPAIGCDEWQPAPVIGAQPTCQVDSPAHGLTFNVVVAGQAPFNYYWSKDGMPVQNDGHHGGIGSANLVVKNFGPDAAGAYQVVVTNASGAVTSAVAQVVIHVVDAASASSASPYSTWDTAASTIQDAINAAAAGDIVLVTNGVYSTGGTVMAGDLTNRVALNKAITVMSVNGYKSTIIQGAWDSSATNGPGAVRCAWVGDGAVLRGFTLQNGATRTTGDFTSGGPLETGGGVWCNSTKGVVANCLLTNNSAIYGGGMANGTLNNSLVIGNYAAYGGGAYYSTLNHCTAVYNWNPSWFSNRGAGTYNCTATNCIVVGNFDLDPFGMPFTTDNWHFSNPPQIPQYSYTCTSPSSGLAGVGNINADPEFLDSFHISSLSPCSGAGYAANAIGVDLDDEPWNNPPAMGCDEVVLSNLVGQLSVSFSAVQTNVLVNRLDTFRGNIAGRAAYVEWSFGDGQSVTNTGSAISHKWTNAGDYAVAFAAYNDDSPVGVTTDMVIHVQPLVVPQIHSPVLRTNGFQFQFAGQTNANYTVQYSTNLVPPVTWQTLRTIYFNKQSVIQITDAQTNAARFYRVLAQ